MSNTIYAKDDGAVTILENYVQWEWDNGADGQGTELFHWSEAAEKLDSAGREDLAELVREALA